MLEILENYGFSYDCRMHSYVISDTDIFITHEFLCDYSGSEEEFIKYIENMIEVKNGTSKSKNKGLEKSGL